MEKDLTVEKEGKEGEEAPVKTIKVVDARSEDVKMEAKTFSG